MQEFPILQEQNVLVTTARFVVGQQTYPIVNLTAVAPFTIPPSMVGSFIGCIAVSGLAAVCALANWLTPGASIGYILAGIFGALALVILVLGMMKKPMHGVKVATAGGQVQALFTPDLQFAHRVVGALNQALSRR